MLASFHARLPPPGSLELRTFPDVSTATQNELDGQGNNQRLRLPSTWARLQAETGFASTGTVAVVSPRGHPQPRRQHSACHRATYTVHPADCFGEAAVPPPRATELHPLELALLIADLKRFVSMVCLWDAQDGGREAGYPKLV